MEPSFWHQRWQSNEIAFHESTPNPLLLKHFHELGLAKGRRVFLPLCGKTLDLGWLLSKGYRVAGAELSQIAIEQLFMHLGRQPEISEVGGVQQWSAKNIDIFVGDLFALTRKSVGPVDAVYDRAALVALPTHMRDRYTTQLKEITATAPQLLITYEYDQRAMDGPPFSVSKEEVSRHYGDRYDLKLLASADVAGGLKGKCPATEHVWRLLPRLA
jgi:thiopurine S-methyltransferase